LNAEQIPGPTGALWQKESIRGRPTRSEGILRNPLYIGRLVWNRRRRLKDPVTGQIVLRPNNPNTVVTVEVPELRIVEQALWDHVQARLVTQAAQREPERPDRPAQFWNQRRPRYLLTGKAVCGACGSRYGLVGQDYLGCFAASQGGCRNTRTMRRGPLEARVLDALARNLMEPSLVAAFADAFRDEWHRLIESYASGLRVQRHELQAIERKIEHTIDAIADGLRHPGLQARLDELGQRRVALQAAVTITNPPPEALPPDLAAIYRQRVASLRVPELETLRDRTQRRRGRHPRPSLPADQGGAMLTEIREGPCRCE